MKVPNEMLAVLAVMDRDVTDDEIIVSRRLVNTMGPETLATTLRSPEFGRWISRQRNVIVDFNARKDAARARLGKRITELMHPALGPTPTWAEANDLAMAEALERGERKEFFE